MQKSILMSAREELGGYIPQNDISLVCKNC